MEKTERSRVEWAARIFDNNKDAAIAIRVARGSFGRLCRIYGIETPYARNRRNIKEALKGKV